MQTEFDTTLPTRLAKSYQAAAFGYARAASAAYAAFADQALDFWSKAARVAPTNERKIAFSVPRPGSRPVHTPAPITTPLDLFQMANPWLDPKSPAFASMRAWWGMFPLEGTPASWPMAFGMMQSGIPRTVAFPAAEANIAAMETASLLQESVTRSYSAYRSDGGHATSHIKHPVALYAAWAMPMAAAFKWPWPTTLS